MTLTSERSTGTVAELRGVDKWYSEHHVLVDVSLRIATGEIVALIGRSGSGKSTVLRVLAGLTDDHGGERVVAGAPYESLTDLWTRARPSRPVLERLVLVGQAVEIW